MNGSEIYNEILQNTHNLKGTWEVTTENYLNVTGITNGSIILFDQTVGALGDFILEWTAEQKGGSYIHSNLCPSLRYTPEDAGIEGGGDNYAMLVYLCNYGGNPGTFNLRTENDTKSTVNTSGVSLNIDTVYTFKFERIKGKYRLYQDGVLINGASDVTDKKLYLGWYLWYGGTNSDYQTNFILREYNLTKINTYHYLDTLGLTTLWSKIKSLFATKAELSNGLNGKANTSGTYSDLTVGNATNATNATNCPNYLPLSGGYLTNNSIGRNVDNSFLHLSGCSDYIKGAMLIMYGEDYTEWAGGGFRLIARNSSTICELDGYPNGTLYWNGTVISSNDNTCDLGNSARRFKDIYATNATINTSDRNAKQDISVIEDKLLDAWGNINPVSFKFISSVEQKGDDARVHTGYIAQDVKEELDKYGIDACKYGLFCYNKWDAQEEQSHEEERTDEDGNTEIVKVIDTPAREAGETYGLRYIECLVVECAYLRKKNKELEDRITKLEENLHA